MTPADRIALLQAVWVYSLCGSGAALRLLRRRPMAAAAAGIAVALCAAGFTTYALDLI
jgi:hypothetical protein